MLLIHRVVDHYRPPVRRAFDPHLKTIFVPLHPPQLHLLQVLFLLSSRWRGYPSLFFSLAHTTHVAHCAQVTLFRITLANFGIVAVLTTPEFDYVGHQKNAGVTMVPIELSVLLVI
ncbi:uncharacterized protein LACBIDRAFT_302494 [Laccaria bicolor S238N-H82]|uniref:Predicted protein n=1 Tax=Laccaria bicolor (strain S238N-H82 / ATCC MYA-4686) TaxID=486041 RepID=B0DHS2_LACBS|nr:uncharacterized protein LACBIDRAFT_302494 [Laccaria bicolor S238N-H82]EDR05779.1 predicted protein [Laccaria bicolor S238N-H82]|eukprot:XP_001883455.1 predicted protein [Laccaria bicolor S238N-H82]